jgi:hypothetical protein
MKRWYEPVRSHRIIYGFHCNLEKQRRGEMWEFVLDFLVNAPTGAVISLPNTE